MFKERSFSISARNWIVMSLPGSAVSCCVLFKKRLTKSECLSRLRRGTRQCNILTSEVESDHTRFLVVLASPMSDVVFAYLSTPSQIFPRLDIVEFSV